MTHRPHVVFLTKTAAPNEDGRSWWYGRLKDAKGPIIPICVHLSDSGLPGCGFAFADWYGASRALSAFDWYGPLPDVREASQ